MGDNTKVEIVRTAEMIAGEINYIKQKATESMISYCIEIGQRLTEAKGIVPHGEWTQWLRDNVDYSQSKAEQLIRVAEEYGDEQINLITGKSKSETFRGIGFSQALALLALPEPERESFVETHDMESMSVRAVQDEIKAIKAERDDLAKKFRETDDALKKANADAADAVSKGMKAKVERDQAVAKMNAEAAKAEEAKKNAAILEKSDKELRVKLAAAIRDAEEAKARAEELEAEEPVQPSMETAVSEEAIEAEREKIRAEYAQKIAAVSNEHMHAFKFAFEQFQQDFRRMEMELSALPDDTAEKLRAKVSEILDGMMDKMEPEEDDAEEETEE